MFQQTGTQAGIQISEALTKPHNMQLWHECNNTWKQQQIISKILFFPWTTNKDNCSARLFQLYRSSEGHNLVLSGHHTYSLLRVLDLTGSQHMCWRSRSSFSTMKASGTTTAPAPRYQTGSQPQWLPKHWLVPVPSSVSNGCTASKLKTKTIKKHDSQLDRFFISVLIHIICAAQCRDLKRN